MQTFHSRTTRSAVRDGWVRAAAMGAVGLAASALFTRYLVRRAEDEHPQRGQFTDIDGTRVHYLDHGQGPVVVVLHGNGAMVEEIESSGLIDALAHTHRVITIDRPGFGLTSRPDGNWSPEREARFMLALVQKLELDRPVIVAHSWATLVAVNMALDEPESISGLVLIGGYFYPTVRADVTMQSVIATPVIGDILRLTIMPFVSRAVAPIEFKRLFAPLSPTPAFLEKYPVDMASRPSQLESVADDTVEMPKAAARLVQRYAELRLPIVLIAGSEDRIVTFDHHSQRLHEELHNSAIDEVPGAGHMVHHARPELIAQRVAYVFDRAPARLASTEAA